MKRKKYKNKETGFEVEAELYEEGKEDFWADKITGRVTSKRVNENSIPYMKVSSEGFVVNKKVDNSSVIVYSKKYKFIFEEEFFLQYYENIK